MSTHEAKEDDAFLIVAQRSSIPTQVYSIQLAYRQSHLKLGKLLWENSAYRSNLEKVWECLWGAGIRERWKESRACGRFGLPEPEPGPAREVRLWESSHAQLLFIIVFIFVNFEERKTRINKRCVRSSNIDKSKKFEHFRCDNFEPRASNKKVPSFQKNKVVFDWRNYDREDKYFIVFSQFVDIVVVNVVVVVDVVFVVALNVAQDETRKGLFRSLCFCCASLVGRRRCRRKQRRSERPTPTSTTPTLTATIFQVALFASVRFWLSKNNPNQWKSEPKSKMQMKEKVLNQTSSKKSRSLWKFSERKKT